MLLGSDVSSGQAVWGCVDRCSFTNVRYMQGLWREGSSSVMSRLGYSVADQCKYTVSWIRICTCVLLLLAVFLGKNLVRELRHI